MSSNNVKKKFYEDMQSFYDQQDKYNFLYAISKCEIREYLRGMGNIGNTQPLIFTLPMNLRIHAG